MGYFDSFTLFSLYIPLCLYFNLVYVFECLFRINLYIPLCLYFNTGPEAVHKNAEVLYIPLCLYFNADTTFLLSSFYALHSIMSLF